mgnify:CR=1 FL=1
MLQIQECCDGCGRCVDICPVEGAIIAGAPFVIDTTKCAECGACGNECPSGAITDV